MSRINVMQYLRIDFIQRILFILQVKDIYLSPEIFTIDNGLMTPTMKCRRPNIKKYFEQQLKQMYSKL